MLKGNRRAGALAAAAVALLVVALAVGSASGRPHAYAAAKLAKVKITGPSSVVAGQRATFRVSIKATKRTLKGYRLEALLSVDRKRNRGDVRLRRPSKLKTVKRRRTRKAKLALTVPAAAPAGSYHLVVCAKGKGRRSKPICAARALSITSVSVGAPAPVPSPTPVPTAQPSPSPQPTPQPTPTPDPDDGTPPAPGPKLAAPPAPEEIAPRVAQEEATSVEAASSFLFEGESKIQTGVDPGTIKPKRIAVLSGRVTNRQGTGISGVKITVADHDEFGQTATQDDGDFDLAVNGGGPLTLVFEREGYIPAQREVDVPWQDFVDVDPMVMVPFAQKETDVDTSGPQAYQVAQAAPVNDGEGERTATLLFEKGTDATMELPDGTKKPVSDMDVRMTEYTQGANGLAAMPGQLPPSTAFTYAAEFSIDEAVEEGATDVRFDKPVVSYTDNFLELPVGTPVPAGYYDREKEQWVGSKDGIVIQVVAIANGLADVSIDADPGAESPAELAAIGMDEAERRRIAGLYATGKQLWRVEITHFTPWDYNMPYGPDGDPTGPNGGGPEGSGNGSGDGSPNDPGDCDQAGSIILCDSQVLGEAIGLTGSDMSLVYRSDRVPGRLAERTVDIPLVGDEIPASGFQGVELEIGVAGQKVVKHFAAADLTPRQRYTFTWDGLNEFGQRTQGSQPVTIRVGFTYRAVYRAPSEFGASWSSLAGQNITGNRSRQEYTIWSEYETSLGTVDTTGVGLGGWTLSTHHAYDPVNRNLIMGDGSQRQTEASRLLVLEPFAGTSSPGFSGDGAAAGDAELNEAHGVAVDPQGRVLIADTENNRIRRVATDGTISTIAGTGDWGRSGDGGPATEARLAGPRAISVAEDGSIYVADTGSNRIRRIRAGQITTVAGGGAPTDGLGDEAPATQARLSGPSGVAIAPDGALYIADTLHHRIRVVGTDGNIHTLAGTGEPAFSGDGGPAVQAAVRLPRGIAVDADGQIVVADTANNRVRRIGLDGVIATIAGGGSPDSGNGDGAAATDARLSLPNAVAIAPDGGILVADTGADRIRRIEPAGSIRTVVGGASADPARPGMPATATRLADPTGVATAPDGKTFIAERTGDRVRRAALFMKGFAEGDQLIASEDGLQLYQFTQAGRHLRTLDALTGGVMHAFDYDAQGRLAGVGDADGPLLTVERDAAGNPAAIVARGGARTDLATNADGYLSAITNPAAETVALAYRPAPADSPEATGLLAKLTDARGGEHLFTYDARGRLLSDEGPGGMRKTLSVEPSPAGTRKVVLETGAGRRWTYFTERLATGDVRRTVTDPSGATTVSVRRSDGTVAVTDPDGTVTEYTTEPDPRFGMQSPVGVKEVVRTPSGLARTTTRARTVDVGSDPTEVQSLTDRITVNGRQWTRSYDGTTRVITSTTPGGRTSTITLDARGREIANRPTGTKHEVQATYGANGHLTTIAQGTRSTTYAYDARQRVSSRTDAAGHTISYGYDGADRITSVTTDTGATWTYAYDANGNVIDIDTPDGDHYDGTSTADDLPDTLQLPQTGSLTEAQRTYDRSYSTDRQLTSRLLPSGVEELSGYDAGGRLTATDTPETTRDFTYVGATERPDVVTWDRAGGGSQQSVDFDFDGLLPAATTFAGQAEGTFTYTSDADLQLSQWSVQAGGTMRTYAIQRDSDRNITREGDWTVQRDPATAEPRRYAAGTLAVDETHDGYGDISGRTVTESGTARYALGVQRDDNGHVTSKTETIGGATTEWTYTYDADDRLKTVSRDGTEIAAYTYDDDGNRTDGGRTYDSQDRITAVGATAYAYDADGFLTGRGGDTFTYGRRGELLSAEVGGVTVTYAYDAMGRRVRRAEGADSTEYLYGNPSDPFQVTATVDENDVLTVLLYDEAGVLRAVERGGSRYAVGSDQVGSPRVVVDEAGAVVKTVDYDAWGVATDQDPAFELPLGFAGGIADATTGLVRFGLRDYDPVAGRWTARDPSMFAGSPMNLYAYVNNNPVSLRDPSGLVCIGMSGYLIIGGGFSLCADGNGIGACAEAGVGLGGGVELDMLEGPQNSDTTLAEFAVGVEGIAEVSISAEWDDCGNVQQKTQVGAGFFAAGMQTSVDSKGKVKRQGTAKAGIGIPIPIQGKLAKKSCRSMSF